MNATWKNCVMNDDDFSTCLGGGTDEGNGVNNKTTQGMGFVNLL